MLYDCFPNAIPFQWKSNKFSILPTLLIYSTSMNGNPSVVSSTILTSLQFLDIVSF